jgi:uncharacterized membrane protein YfhO
MSRTRKLAPAVFVLIATFFFSNAFHATYNWFGQHCAPGLFCIRAEWIVAGLIALLAALFLWLKGRSDDKS